jgi:hypothetical protein
MFVFEKTLLLFMTSNNSILLSAPNVPHGPGVQGKVSGDGAVTHTHMNSLYNCLGWCYSLGGLASSF